jgi:hypothetical protein
LHHAFLYKQTTMDVSGQRRAELNNFLMQEICVGEWMQKMNDKDSCIRNMAYFVAPNTSVSQISRSCDAMNAKFTVDDAKTLCSGLNEVHAQFWPSLKGLVPTESDLR